MSDLIYDAGMLQHSAQVAFAITSQLSHADPAFHSFIQHYTDPRRHEQIEAFIKGEIQPEMDEVNERARWRRANPRSDQAPNLAEWRKARRALGQPMAKANLDVGTLTNFAQITGGQSLGYVSLDTNLARGTVRPSSFTLYQCLHKTRAFQVVDYWAYASDTGGAPPGAAVANFTSVGSGTLATSAGKYSLKNINLALALDGRAITTALAAQNSFVDVGMQENTNAALVVLQTLDWLCYWGDISTFPNQFNGIYKQIPTANQIDFQAWYNANAASYGWTQAQALFNLIYQFAGQLTSINQFGHVTHAFMGVFTAGALQQLTTTLLNNIVNNATWVPAGATALEINGDLQGMKTRFGKIQFPIDIFIAARDVLVQAVLNADGTNQCITSLTAPSTVTVAVATGTASSWTLAYAPTGSVYTTYAVVACDASSNETSATFATPISGIATNGTYTVTISGITAGTQAFRVFRSGLCTTATQVTGQNLAAVRYVGTVLASGTAGVTFTDTNAKIPGSEVIFMLDMDESDNAIDYRWMLPLTKVELFAQNLYMPWAVCAIGAVRLRVPKFHGVILNFVPDNPEWNPLSSNVNAAV